MNPPATTPPLAHALSVDVEDWFQVLNLARHVDRADWDKLELRCAASTRRLLELFARRGARATFFVLGWVAERVPELVREIAAAGHEIGSHGYDHRVLDELGPEGFREDLRRTARVLGELTGRAPVSFRACTWSITSRTLWAPAILAEEGYVLDSSIYPVTHPDYGIQGAPVRPYRLRTAQGELAEFPPLTVRILGRRVPVGGGGYLRLFPLWVMERGLRQAAAEGWPGCVYLHPWEVDPEQPRVKVGGLRGFRHYVNLARTLPKLDRLLARFRFVGLAEALAQCESWRAKWAELDVSGLSG
ncbi:MAG: DUF3473 domain-containing protein [Planctomycetes bacterium]|nr:DUF3473 domain-containing protein [Planctomycetota bacterium]